ncbi:MAG TPA: ATP-binding protein [Polyangiaceae bacterium]|jgi:two-component system NtrC family sensor kinase|nr:ATP-binding protein [Polyangiaceae bacterium]
MKPSGSFSIDRSNVERPAVLAVDDVEANLIALQALLDDMECDVVLARSGNEALRQLLRRDFALILLDVQMPGMDGYEVAHHARRNLATRDVPIIFLTAANNSEGMVLRGYGSGAVDFLFKPLNAAILRSKVRVFLELRSAHQKVEDAKSVLERTNSELKTAYGELQATHAQLVQAAKMASLGELVAGVAHEINNPLAFVLSHLDTVRRSLGQVETELAGQMPEGARQNWQRAQDRLREMTPGLERIRDLVVKLRAFSRLDEGERKKVSMRECVESVLTILGHRLRAGITVETHFGEPDEVECYASLLNQAIMNLVANSIDAMGAAGTLRISTGADGDQYQIVVDDTGSGIPPDLRERVIEPFFTTKPVGQGTGLGLSITYSIVQKHGGTLEFRDGAAGGTSVSIRFPLTRSEATQ